MADLGFRILLIASVAVLVLAAIEIAWVIRTRHASGHTEEPPDEGPEPPARSANQLCRSAGIGTGIEYVLDPAPTPPAHVSGGNVFVPWAEG